MSNNDDSRYIYLSLLNIYEKISKQSTILVGLELFRQLIKDYISDTHHMNVILNEIYDYSKKLKGKDKKEPLTLLPIIIQYKQGYLYLNKILAIITVNIDVHSESIFEFISNVYGEITLEIEKSNNKKQTECICLLRQFCFDYLNQKIFSNTFFDISKCYQICGFLFLYKLINNSDVIISDDESIKEIFYIITSYFNLITSKAFYAKNEMLRSLLILIIRTQKRFAPYAQDALSHIIDVINHSLTKLSWENKKYILEIVYNIILFCPEESNVYIDEIISFAKICKVDKVKEVRMISLSILKVIGDVKGIKGLYSSQGSSDKKNNVFLSSVKKNKIGKCRSFREKVDYNDKFVFVEKKIEREEEDEKNNEDSNQKIKNVRYEKFEKSVNDIKYQMKILNKMQNDLLITVNKVEKTLTTTVNDFTKRIDTIERKINIIHNSSTKEVNSIEEAINDDNKLIKVISKMNQSEINELSNEVCEDIIDRLINMYNINKDNKKEMHRDLIRKIYSNIRESGKLKENTVTIVTSII